VASLFAGNFSDTADAVPGGSAAHTFIGVVLTGNAATTAQGRWQWLNGTTWSNIATSYTDSAGVFFTAATLLRFLPAANYNGTPGPLTVRLVDSSATGLTNGRSVNVAINGGTTPYSAASVTLGTSVTAVNDAPLATGAATLAATPEDATNPPGATVASLFAGNFTDTTDAVPGGSPAHTLAGVVLVANAATLSQGRWQWLSGTTWTTIGTTLSDTSGVFFTAATALRFLPAANYNGTPGALTVRLVDSSAAGLTNGRSVNVAINGGTTPFSAAKVVLGTSVTAVNDAPVATGKATLAATTQDATNPPGVTVASLFAGNFADVADAVPFGSAAHTLAGVVFIANTATAAQGRWQWLDGATWKDVATNLTRAAGLHLSAATVIRFLPAANYSGTPGALTARLVDSSATGLTNGGPANVSTSGGVTPFSAANVVLGTSVSAAIALQP
jgi:muramidase (phage lysozyme)